MKDSLNQIVPVYGDLDLFSIAHNRLLASLNALEIGRAPDAALAFDVQALPAFGFNSVRLHQKVNPDRWYWHADRLGVVVLQDIYEALTAAAARTGRSKALRSQALGWRV